MTDRPIIFSAPMVRALLAGTKTQTRRVLTSARVFAAPERSAWTLRGDDLKRALQNADRFRRVDGDGWFWEADAFEWQAPHTRTGWLAHIGYAPGDRLYVRENFSGPHEWSSIPPAGWGWDTMVRPKIWFWADGNPQDGDWTKPRPSIHMPRWSSRLTLIVTDVRIERLQDISRDDAIAEGATSRPSCSGFRQLNTGWSMDWSEVGNISRYATGGPGPLLEQDISHGDPRSAFGGFINLLHGGERWNCNGTTPLWDQNPFVVAISFEVIKANIETLSHPTHTLHPQQRATQEKT